MYDRATARLEPSTRAYGHVSMTLHWALALLIIVQVGLGWYMNDWLPDHSPAQARVVGLHISVGLTILLLVLIRIGVRVTHPAPPLPESMPAWERLLARASHVLFYVLMLALPLTGWALVSLGARPISFWGLAWPHLPGLGFLAGDRPMRHNLQQVHTSLLVWTIIGNLALHVAGALKHQFDGRPVLWRMIPGLGR